MWIVGYADAMSVAPGETIRFMVSCELPEYRAQIVRLIHGDINPAGPGTGSAAGLALSADGGQQFLYVADYGNSRVLVLDRYESVLKRVAS